MRYRSVVFLLTLGLLAGCSSYQPTKNVWKGTKSLWYTYASPPASVDYNDKGDLSEGALRLSQCMFSIDAELTRLERVMLNADKPPSQEWISNFIIEFPWVNGIAGVKYDGTILGQEPPTPLKELDYIPLLYEDKKQKRNALRGDTQITPLGPEVLLAAPLYESAYFLGIVCAHFDMRTLAATSQNADHLVVLSPQGLLWPGQYDFASTPLAGLDWAKLCTESSSGSCSNANGKFLYQVRYLGNLPLVFAVAEKGTFPKGNGSVEQGLAFFPKDRPKLPPPPVKERKDTGIPVFAKPEEMVPDIPPPDENATKMAEQQEAIPQPVPRPVRKRERRQVRYVRREIPAELLIPPPPPKPVHVKPDLNLGPDLKGPTLPGGRPSPFSAQEDSGTKTAPAAEPSSGKTSGTSTPVPDTGATEHIEKTAPPAQEKPKQEKPKQEEPKQESPKHEEPKMLPGGRPNPFGS